MLLLFAISVTPKQLLHDVITGHKHSNATVEGIVNVQNSKNSFQCSWQNDAIVSPFTGQPDFQHDGPVIPHSPFFNYYILKYYSADILFSFLRGPPSQV